MIKKDRKLEKTEDTGTEGRKTNKQKRARRMHYLQKRSDNFNFGQKKFPNIKRSKIFQRSKCLQYSVKLLLAPKLLVFFLEGTPVDLICALFSSVFSLCSLGAV